MKREHIWEILAVALLSVAIYLLATATNASTPQAYPLQQHAMPPGFGKTVVVNVPARESNPWETFAYVGTGWAGLATLGGVAWRLKRGG